MAFPGNSTKILNQALTFKSIWHDAALRKESLHFRAVEFNTIPIINSITYPERSCLYTSSKIKHSPKGSITIEAAIGFPIFFLLLMSLVYIINIMYLQTSLQIALEETIRDASKTAYITAEFLAMTNGEQSDAVQNDSSLLENLGGSLITSSYIHNAFLTESNKKILEASCVKNGANGISFLSSSIDTDAGIADIIMTYKVTIPFLPEDLFNLNLSNRCYVRLYTGLDMAKKQTAATPYVYYTTSGSVYHFNKYCQYLLNYTEAVRFNDRNHELSSCPLCDEGISLDNMAEQNPLVYVTLSSYCYHSSLDCQAFTGDIFRIKYSSSIKKDDICETCLKGK